MGTQEHIVLPSRESITPGYWDFPQCKEAFATGQSDARPEVIGNCYWRRRGRTARKMTLISFEDPREAWSQLKELKEQGAKVQSLNYTLNIDGLGIPTSKALTEWVAYDWPLMFSEATGKFGTTLRWNERQVEVRSAPSYHEAVRVFESWIQWAGTRHFMVFKGHYARWIELFYHGNRTTCHMISVYKNGTLAGIFGWEEYKGLKQVTIAKHTPAIKGKMLWIAGLLAAGNGKVLCGSTADTLKSQLGLVATPSWSFDLRKL